MDTMVQCLKNAGVNLPRLFRDSLALNHHAKQFQAYPLNYSRIV